MFFFQSNYKKICTTCDEVIPILKASLTLSLVIAATTMFGNLYKRSQNKAKRLICKCESLI